MPTDDPPIEGFVPLPPEPDQTPEAPPRRKPGPKPGTPRSPRRNGLVAAPSSPLDKFDVDALRRGKEGHCDVCGVTVAPMSLELVRELVRSGRDRLKETSGEMQSAIAVADLFYLAARLDGLCGIACWRKRAAAE